MHMNTKIIFNTDKKLKMAAQKKAKKQGLTLSAVLNRATRAYVEDSFDIGIISNDIARAREQIRQGKYVTHEQLVKELGIKI
jgi:hypothetical protein